MVEALQVKLRPLVPFLYQLGTTRPSRTVEVVLPGTLKQRHFDLVQARIWRNDEAIVGVAVGGAVPSSRNVQNDEGSGMGGLQ